MNIIISLLKALLSFIQLKNVSFYYDAVQKSRQIQKQYEDEIENLRNNPSNDNSDRADLLRGYLMEEKRFIESISAFYSDTIERKPNPDKGGNISSTDGK